MPGRFIGIRVPRGAVALLLGRLDETPLSLVPPRTEALNLLVTYASALAETLRLTTPELQRLAVGHMHDLVAATIRATRDGRAIAEGRGIAAARLQAIMTTISTHLGDGDLSVAEIARRHRVTQRYVHKLFENEGLTFSLFVLGQRLSRAHRLLSNPHLADRNISSVAFDVGFGDLSYFNRTFRRRYGVTDRDQAVGDQGLRTALSEMFAYTTRVSIVALACGTHRGRCARRVEGPLYVEPLSGTSFRRANAFGVTQSLQGGAVVNGSPSEPTILLA
jgi:AraC-like DNA-binding protein